MMNKYRNAVFIVLIFMIQIASNTVLKAQIESPNRYSRSELAYMMNNGFDPTGYDWMHPEINNLLDQALIERRNPNGLLVLSSLAFCGTTTYSIFEQLVWAVRGTEPTSGDRLRVAGVFMLGSAALIGAAVNKSTKRKKSKRHLWWAQQLKVSLYPNIN